MRKLKGVAIIVLFVILLSTLYGCIGTQTKPFTSTYFCEVKRESNRYNVDNVEVTLHYGRQVTYHEELLGEQVKITLGFYIYNLETRKYESEFILRTMYMDPYTPELLINKDNDGYSEKFTIPKEWFNHDRGMINFNMSVEHEDGSTESGSAHIYYKKKGDKV
ncbi:MAG: hypothetical protein IJ033_01645, partial [Clostridia bacterium]|nr:hypothetical protein [Clostridia bacterium]